MTTLPFSATTPVSVARVGLNARDHEALAGFYRSLLGLKELRREGSTIALGTGERELLEINGDAALRPDDPRAAGLFHTAFLFPERADLARWIRSAGERGIRIDGASDHLVSEALYLSDPEGNGIEIYADRPRDKWPHKDGQIEMATIRLDFDSVMAEPGADLPWQGAPDGTVVGHVHLRVGDVEKAETWWNKAMGLDTMTHYGNAAVFLASGGYHHHVGANIWQSRGAGPRDAGRSGLGFVELASRLVDTASETIDPWGTVVRTVPALA